MCLKGTIPFKKHLKNETESNLLPHEDSIEAMIDTIFIELDENSFNKVNLSWTEIVKRWFVALKEASSSSRRYQSIPLTLTNVSIILFPFSIILNLIFLVTEENNYDDPIVQKTRVFHRYSSGELKLLEIRISPFYTETNEVVLIQLVDVSYEVKLQDAVDQLEQKDRLLRFVSHEFRTPINCTLSLLDMLKNLISINLCTHYLQPAIHSSKMLLSLVNDILDFSMIKANKLRVSIQPCHLRKTMEEVTDMMKIQAQAHNIQLRLEWDSDIPRIFYTDAHRLKQILLNLVSNAFKFTTRGSVTIRATRIESFSSTVAVRIEVIDTGTGISKQGLDSLFREFNRVQENNHLNPRGIGLGLVISKLLSHELCLDDDGLSVESEEGKGTTFFFVLASKAEEVLKQDYAAKTGDMEISDDEDRERPNGLISKLKNQNFRMIDPATKYQLREDVLRMQTTDEESPRPSQNHIYIQQQYQQSPPKKDEQQMYKLKVIEFKKAVNNTEARPKITRMSTIVKSSTVLSSTVGMVDPIRLSALSQGSNLVKNLPKREYSKPTKTRPKSIGRSHTSIISMEGTSENNQTLFEFVTLVHNLNTRCKCAKILIVDDNAFNLTAVSLVLKSMEIDSISVVDGELAIQRVVENQGHNPKCKNFSVIFMDIEMPRMDGFETTKILRKKMLEGVISFIPIIGITGHNPYEKRIECLLSGMNDMIIKPITPQILQETIFKWVDYSE